MKTFALIENHTVVNVIESDQASLDAIIEALELETNPYINITDISPRPGIGWQYAPGTGFTAPAAPDSAPAPAPIPEPRIITNLAFDLRFTLEERVAIELASIDDPSASMEQRAQAAGLRVSQERAKKAAFTDLDDPVARGGVLMMEQAQLLAAGRALEILDAPIQDHEIPA